MSTSYSIGNITFQAPSSWSVHEIETGIEIIEEQGQGALHISFLRRLRADDPQESEARLLVENFAINNKLDGDGTLVFNICDHEARAAGMFHPREPTAEVPLYWWLVGIVWRNNAVRLSYCTDVVRPDVLSLAVRTMASVRSSLD